MARLSAAFGGGALLLACLGLYGVTAYSVTRRTREIGIRMAVGASRGRVVVTVLRGAVLQFVVSGLAIGVPAAFAAGRLLESMLFGVSPGDPLSVAGGCRDSDRDGCRGRADPGRAAALDPVEALRLE